MHSPTILRNKLIRQWENHTLRESRLLDSTAFPIILPIGKPSPTLISSDLDSVRAHLKHWRNEKHATVIWEKIPSRHSSEPIEIPSHWQINTLEEWITTASLQKEASPIKELITTTHPRYHSLLIRNRTLWKNQPLNDIIQACSLADILEPSIANGAPLRALSLAGIDTKFFGNYRNLIIRLLDLRFDGQVSQIGLETFLNATHENPHWILVADLGKDLLPFHKQRISTHELATFDQNIPHTILIENENCLHLLPPLKHTLAILGSGLDLAWLTAPFLEKSHVSYWGDIDTWGLQMLATARQYLPHIKPLLMTQEIFDSHPTKTVTEPNPAPTQAPQNLTPQETALYHHLRSHPKGRLEQEFLPPSQVHSAFQTSHQITSVRS